MMTGLVEWIGRWYSTSIAGTVDSIMADSVPSFTEQRSESEAI